jgi:4-amino-4-deoxy-L-arabinose transferase-like glycosyltransferase
MKTPRFPKISIWLWVALALLSAIGLKAWLLVAGRVPFNADEAVVALMGRHILQGAHPVFFYGQFYMGSLDALLVAVAFALFGEQAWVIRLVQGLLYLGVLVTTGLLGKRAFGSSRVGVLAMLLLAIPTVNVTLYTTASLGGYGEALLLGNLTLLLGLRLGERLRAEERSASLGLWGLLGFLIGLGLWAFGLTLVYSLPTLIYLAALAIKSSAAEASGDAGSFSRQVLRRGSKWLPALLALLVGGLFGALPWLGYALQPQGEKLVMELGGSAIAGVERLPWIFQVGRHTMSLLLLGSTVTLGLRPPWSASWLALPLLPFVLMFWMIVLLDMIRRLRVPGPHRPAQALLAGVMATLIAAFILTPFGADPSGRYFLPLAAPLALFAAAMILDLRQRVGVWAYGLVILLMIYNLWGVIQSAGRFPPGLTTQFHEPTQVDHRDMGRLIQFLQEQGERRGYSNYWVAYPRAFLSGEELIFVPRLPYHLDFRYTARDDRYLPYGEQVAQAERVAYITTRHADLDQRLRQEFSKLGVTWQETQIGDYHVFYALSRAVRPQEIGLGETTNP